MTNKAQRVLSFFVAFMGGRRIENIPEDFQDVVLLFQMAVSIIQLVFAASIYDAVEPSTDAPAEEAPDLSKSIAAILSGANIAVGEIETDDGPDPAQAEKEVIVAWVTALRALLQANRGNEAVGLKLVLHSRREF